MPIIVVDPSKEIGEPGYQSQYSEKPWAGWPRRCDSILGKGKRFISIPKHPDLLGTHAPLYPMGTEGACPGSKAVAAVWIWPLT
jgi:hypothetical protein